MEEEGTNKIFVKFFFVYLFFLLMGALAVLGIIKEQFLTKDRVTADDLYKEQVLEPVRGSILSWDGRPLAVSIPVYELRWDSKVPVDSVWSQGLDSLAEGLAAVFKDKSAEAWRRELSAARRSGNRYKQIGNRTVDYGELSEIESLPIFRLGQFEGGLIVIKDSHQRRWGRSRHRIHLRLQTQGRERPSDCPQGTRRRVAACQRSSGSTGRGRSGHPYHHRCPYPGGCRDRAAPPAGHERCPGRRNSCSHGRGYRGHTRHSQHVQAP